MKKKSLFIPELSEHEMPRVLAETTRKLNMANRELAEANARLNQLNRELTEANRELDESNHRLNELNESIIQADRRRKCFYANISHDLRAPITAISNITEVLLSQLTEDDPDRLSVGDAYSNTEHSAEPAGGNQKDMRRMLQIVQSRTEYLKNMINDVFLLSSLDSTEKNRKEEPVDIGFFLEDYYYMCEADAAYESAELHLQIEENLDCILLIDPDLMHRVLDNLFSNAFKYGGEHPVIVLGVYRDLPAGQLVFYVEDHGKGIAADQLESVFEWSYRADSARTPGGASGSGFGLAIVKMIVERHHGTVSCISSPGEGTRFSVSLPLHDAAALKN